MIHDLVRRIEKLGSPRVVVVGDLILDRYIWGYAERISQEAPVPLLRRSPRASAWRGGKCRNHGAHSGGASASCRWGRIRQRSVTCAVDAG